MPKEKQEKSKSKGKYCCAGGCTSSYNDNVSLHLFPKETERRKKWIKFIKDEQKNFDKPTPYQAICEKHFKPECYPMKYRLMDSMEKGKGYLYTQKRLNPDAVPTIHTKPSKHEASASQSQQPHVQACTMRSAARKYAVSRIVGEYSQSNKISDKQSDLSNQQGSSSETEQSRQSCDTHTEAETNTDANKEVGIKFVSKGTQLKRLGVRSVGVQRRHHYRSKGNQTNLTIEQRTTTNIGVQCNMSLADFSDGKVLYPNCSARRTNILPIEEEDNIDDTEVEVEYGSDDDYVPSDVQSDDEDDMEMACQACLDVGKKFLVFESQLMILFTTCPRCSSLTHPTKSVVGTMVSITQECFCGFRRRWTSQPMLGSVPAGNLEMSAAILFSGSIPTKALRCMNHMGVVCISTRTFHNHQRQYLLPSILQVWEAFQQRYIAIAKTTGQELTLGGDGRADTPGHSAKYGSYSMVDLDRMVVIDVQLVQCNEVKSSCHMEKEGFIRSVNYLKSHDLHIKEFVSDRHPQIVKHIREKMPETRHFFDVWHVSKGLKKKLNAVSKEKNCDDVSMWIKSITNHMYWVASSTPDGNGDVMLAKWESILNHVTDVHRHENSLFPACQHEVLEQPRQWLKPDTKAFIQMEKSITSTHLRKAIRSLSPGPQTAGLEGFHSVINHFAPKMIGFSYTGMLGRLILSALHFNENMQREQATCKDGTKQYNIVYPKYKAGESSLKEVKVDCTYGYVGTLMKIVHERALGYQGIDSPLPVSPPTVCSRYTRPSKTQAIEQHESRYK